MEPLGAIVFLPREGAGDSPLLLEPLMFTPAALWLSETLRRAGAERFFVVCHDDDRAAALPCFPEGTQFVTTGTDDARERLKAFLDLQERVLVFTRPVFLTRAGAESVTSTGPWADGAGTGIFRVSSGGLKAGLEGDADLDDALREAGEEYPRRLGGVWSIGRDDSFEERENMENAARWSSVERLRRAGVRFIDAAAAYIDPTVNVGRGTVILPGTILRGRTEIGRDCEIGPNSVIRDCSVGNRVTVNASQLNESRVDDGAKVGPFAYVRPNCHVGAGAKVGDFVELKNSTIGAGTKISHLTYVGDSDVGKKVNLGCGTVTVNYDGAAKYRTVIGDNAFIGCNSNLVAPVRIGEGAYTAAGSTITDDVPADSLAIARSPQSVKVQWAAKRRKRK